ncbi:hypothetical protein CH063_09899 [Colletotrichum higginsianum]|uniref:RanBP2-type domain-containing protein n=1 Tax=Colletotrichum higginsianum (strain IMI 349063) TaxID=759273 RepID=H1VFC5_COLHI|nr:hypothetical protein CH063_09899 [Colletotrichum higginsianum]
MPRAHAPRTRTKVVWFCHKCGNGPNNYSLDEYCPYCQKRRCHQCTVQEIQVRVDH